jgi:hypothetical protein
MLRVKKERRICPFKGDCERRDEGKYFVQQNTFVAHYVEEHLKQEEVDFALGRLIKDYPGYTTCPICPDKNKFMKRRKFLGHWTHWHCNPKQLDYIQDALMPHSNYKDADPEYVKVEEVAKAVEEKMKIKTAPEKNPYKVQGGTVPFIPTVIPKPKNPFNHYGISVEDFLEANPELRSKLEQLQDYKSKNPNAEDDPNIIEKKSNGTDHSRKSQRDLEEYDANQLRNPVLDMTNQKNVAVMNMLNGAFHDLFDRDGEKEISAYKRNAHVLMPADYFECDPSCKVEAYKFYLDDKLKPLVSTMRNTILFKVYEESVKDLPQEVQQEIMLPEDWFEMFPKQLAKGYREYLARAVRQAKKEIEKYDVDPPEEIERQEKLALQKNRQAWKENNTEEEFLKGQKEIPVKAEDFGANPLWGQKEALKRLKREYKDFYDRLPEKVRDRLPVPKELIKFNAWLTEDQMHAKLYNEYCALKKEGEKYEEQGDSDSEVEGDILIDRNNNH